MATLNTVFWAIVVLGVLIFVHELGHFLVARWAGVRVLVFSLGFGPRLFSWRPGGANATEYQLALVPLGGYVKMLGESGDEDEPELTERERPFSFGAKPVGHRFAIVAAGPLFNVLFALMAVIPIYLMGVNELLPVIGKVQPGMPAESAGLQIGDRILKIDGVGVERWDQFSRTVQGSGGRRLVLTVERGAGEALEISVQPQVQQIPNLFGEPVVTALIGVSPDGSSVVVRYGVLDSVMKGAEKTWWMVDLTLTSIWKLVTGVVPANQIGGPVMIAELAGKSAAMGLSNLLFFMALISINLAILNLLPVPVLDGGHLLFLAVEKLKGAPLGETAQQWAGRFGMAFLGGLMLFALYNDLARLFTGSTE
jgi:regulator of sigma E protease